MVGMGWNGVKTFESWRTPRKRSFSVGRQKHRAGPGSRKGLHSHVGGWVPAGCHLPGRQGSTWPCEGPCAGRGQLGSVSGRRCASMGAVHEREEAGTEEKKSFFKAVEHGEHASGESGGAAAAAMGVGRALPLLLPKNRSEVQSSTATKGTGIGGGLEGLWTGGGGLRAGCGKK